jgi:hypothetical protein
MATSGSTRKAPTAGKVPPTAEVGARLSAIMRI